LPCAIAACSGGAIPPQDTHTASAGADSTPGTDATTDAAAEMPRPIAVNWCKGATAWLWDPAAATSLSAFPDDAHTVDDAQTPTGVRVQFGSGAKAMIDATPASYRGVFTDLQTLDGWGVTAGIVLRFTDVLGELPSGATSTLADSVRLLDLGDAKPVKVPFEVQRTDEGKSAILWPMLPLRPRTRHAVVVTRQLLDAKGLCLAPSPSLRSIHDHTATDAALLRLRPRHEEVLTKTGLQASDLSALLVFTTQSTWHTGLAIADDIAARGHPWTQKLTCQLQDYTGKDGKPAQFRACTTAFAGHDYRKGRTIADGKPVKDWTMPVAVWLPPAGKGPFPVVVFGHGLGSGKDQGKALAEVAAPQGMATVAIDAVQHAQHPGGGNKGTFNSVLAFFAIDPAIQSVDPLKLRDHFRQSSYDGLQLIDAISDQPDLDGDGAPELDPQHVAYVGVSLGGIMGPPLLSLTPRVQAAVLAVAGARVGAIIADSATFAPIIFALKPEGTTDGDVDRFFPVLQTLLDAGDPAAVWAGLAQGRGDGSVPHVLQTMAIADAIVPNSANRALARAIGLPLVPPVVQPVGLLNVAGKAPLQGNGPKGATWGLFQYDRVTKEAGGKVLAAEHDNVPGSREGLHQAGEFLKAWLATGVARIVDPYLELGTAGLGK
jgi:dienelactone hydrolase